MKKLPIYTFVFVFTFLGAGLFAQNLFDITSPFKLWLLNNEARVLTSLNFDANVIEQLSSPFSIMPDTKESLSNASEDLWNLHRKYYKFLDNIQGIYTKVKRFETGKLSILLKRARPEIWCFSGLETFEIILKTGVTLNIREAWHQTMLQALDINPVTDKDLNNKLANTLSQLTGTEKRILSEYFATFAALYPTNIKIRQLDAFIKAGSRSQPNLGIAIQDIIHLKEVIRAEFDSTDNLGIDSLLELEAIMSDSSTDSKLPQKQATDQWFDETTTDEEDIFNIW